MSFKDKHALETLPETIEALRGKVDRLQHQLTDPTLYSRDPEGFAKLSLACAETQTALDAAENEWLRLEILREEIAP